VLNKDIAFAIIKLLDVTEGGSGRLRTDGGGYGYDRITGYPYKFTNPIAGKKEQRKTSLTVGLWGFQIW
jgi:penicillin-binding protein 1A